jgi:hypothetical protein
MTVTLPSPVHPRPRGEHTPEPLHRDVPKSPSLLAGAAPADSEPVTWWIMGPARTPSSISLLVNSDATIWPVSASTPRCSFRQDRRVLEPCFSTSHSPAPHNFSPVLSTTKWTGRASSSAAVGGGRGTANVAERRLSVGWSGTRCAASAPSGSPTANTRLGHPASSAVPLPKPGLLHR